MVFGKKIATCYRDGGEFGWIFKQAGRYSFVPSWDADDIQGVFNLATLDAAKQEAEKRGLTVV